MKKTRIAVYISDVGFGHMIRQREIIKYLLLKFKNSEITIVNALQLEILRETFKDKVKYLKRFNNIELFKSKEGYLDINLSSKNLDSWHSNLKRSFKFFKKNFSNHDLIISDFVPEVFHFSKIFGIKSYGVCHYSWSWFFEKICNKKKIISRVKNYENKANLIFFPPFTPKGVYKNIVKKNKIINVNFIIKQPKFVSTKNEKKTILIMDSGTKSMANLISNTIPYIKNNDKYIFYIGIASLTAKAKNEVFKSSNLIPVTTLSGLYSYISKVDYVITRAGFNSMTECLIFKKPSIFMGERYNPEIKENLKFISKLRAGGLMNTTDWGKNFLKRLEFFIKNEKEKILNNLKLINYDINGSKQIVNLIKKDLTK